MKSPLFLAMLAAANVSAASAQPEVTIRFSNGTNFIMVDPGTAVPVSVYATGMPSQGQSIPWTTPPGTGQLGTYAGFRSVLFNVLGTSGTWSNLTIPAGMGYQNPPLGSAGTISGPNVNGINIGVLSNPPVTGNEFLLWRGTLTVFSINVNLTTEIRPVGTPPQTGFEVALSGISGGFVSHYVQTSSSVGIIGINSPHPATPGAVAVLGLGGLIAARRRR